VKRLRLARNTRRMGRPSRSYNRSSPSKRIRPRQHIQPDRATPHCRRLTRRRGKRLPTGLSHSCKMASLQILRTGPNDMRPCEAGPCSKSPSSANTNLHNPKPRPRTYSGNHDALILFPAEQGHDSSEQATDSDSDAGLGICPDHGWADTIRYPSPTHYPSTLTTQATDSIDPHMGRSYGSMEIVPLLHNTRRV
jgi:hypothetical protein